ncbi:hypothetical protein AVEN_62199-1 [Araneus ventricosus]|uniref:Uncharacterized protein n=1 Tax=Araneus ventricosus TaxID=182803 RepID=A0A4Y2M7Z7_ARAVE|nr:hypothetical protein AVEN_62199-1 [Araneus ventricosus]
MTRTTPFLAPLSKLPHHTNGKSFGPLLKVAQDYKYNMILYNIIQYLCASGDAWYSVQQSHIHGGSSAESCFELGTFRHRDVITRPPRPHLRA